MKLRIKGNSLRLRLSRSEVCQVRATGRVSDGISFGLSPGQRLTYVLETPESVAAGLQVVYDDHSIVVRVPREIAVRWADDDEQIGIDGAVANGSDDALRVLIEKDFACLARSPDGLLRADGEDDSDAFPNPNAALGVC